MPFPETSLNGPSKVESGFFIPPGGALSASPYPSLRTQRYFPGVLPQSCKGCYSAAATATDNEWLRGLWGGVEAPLLV